MGIDCYLLVSVLDAYELKNEGVCYQLLKVALKMKHDDFPDHFYMQSETLKIISEKLPDYCKGPILDVERIFDIVDS